MTKMMRLWKDNGIIERSIIAMECVESMCVLTFFFVCRENFCSIQILAKFFRERDDTVVDDNVIKRNSLRHCLRLS